MRIFVILAAFVLLCTPTTSMAARLTFDAESAYVGTGEPFSLAVNLSTDEHVNAIALSIRVPTGFEVQSVSDGNSVVSLWIDRPAYESASRIVSLSGLMPGGFSGSDGRLITMRVRALADAAGTFEIDTQLSSVLLNTVDAREAQLDTSAVTIESRTGAHLITNAVPDVFPPEHFSPQIVPVPGNERAWMVVFATQDKLSGVEKYQVRERNIFLPWASGMWKDAESPYVLAKTGTYGRVDVRAIDGAGNIREESARPATKTAIAVDILLALVYIGSILGILDALRRTLPRE